MKHVSQQDASFVEVCLGCCFISLFGFAVRLRPDQIIFFTVVPLSGMNKYKPQAVSF